MGRSWRIPGVISIMIMIAGLAAIWFAFAPVKLGGQVTNILVNGISMEPNFHSGDLVIVRQSPDYQVGDVVTYHDAEMEANVIHRIIGTEGDRFILKGDNNSWIDGHRPTYDEIAGKLWIYLPKLGGAVEWVRTPINMALTIGLLGGIIMANMTMQKQHKNGKQKNNASGNPAGLFEIGLYLFGILALVFLVLSLFTFSRPTLRAADAFKYQHSGVFFYSAAGAPGVYDSNSAQSGEPLFTRLTCTLNLGFTYTLTGDQLENITGYQQFNATVRDKQSGWKRTIPLTADKNFSGNTYTSQVTLDLCQIEDLVASVEKKTGFRLSSYKLDVVNHVTVLGKIAGQDFADTFEPDISFNFDSLRFFLEPDAKQADPLITVESRSFSNPGKVENTIKLFGLNPTVRGLRIISILGLFISLSGLVGLGFYYISASKRDQEAVIRIKYGSMIMNVYDRGVDTLNPVIDVTTIEDLANLAKRQNAMIMHLKRDHLHYYFVQTEGTTYRFVIADKRAVNMG